MGLGNNFLDMTQKGQATKAKINKWDYIIQKKFLHGAPGQLSQLSIQPLVLAQVVISWIM